MKLKCSKCGKEINDGNVCLSLVDKTELCNECATMEALEMHGDKNPEETLKEMENA